MLYDGNQVKKGQLDNGLRIYHAHRPGTQTVALALVMPVGARHEPRKLLGISHLLEHMAVNETERWNAHTLKEAVDRRGGYFNAATSQEYTAYMIVLPANEADFGFEYLYSPAFAPRLTQESLEVQKRIIDNEALEESSSWERWVTSWKCRLGLTTDLAAYSVFEMLRGSDLSQHPIGRKRTRRRITLENVVAHFNRYYNVAEAKLIAVGDLPFDRVRALAESTFGSVAPKPNHPRKTTPPPEKPLGRRRFWLMTRSSYVHIKIQIPCNGAQDRQRSAYDFLYALLRDALLRQLRQQRGWIYDIDTLYVMRTDWGIVGFDLRVPFRHVQEVEREISHIFDRFRRGEIDPDSFDRVLRSGVGSARIQLQNNADYLGWLMNEPGLLIDRHWEPWDFRPQDASLEAVQEAARHFLHPDNRLLLVHHPSRAYTFFYWLLKILVFLATYFTLASLLLILLIRLQLVS